MSPTPRSRQLATALLVAASFACSPRHPAPPPSVPVTVATVERGPVPEEMTANGTVEPLKTAALQAQVGGVLMSAEFREGQEVQEGQVLFRIEPQPYETALAQAEAVLARDEAQSRNADQNAQRLQVLVDKDYVTAQQFEDAKASAAALRATVAADRAAVESARINLQHATIRSPFAGRAGAILVRPGNLIKASTETLVVINQLRPILVRFAVSATGLPRLRRYPLNTLTVRVSPPADSTQEREGRVTFMDNAVDSATGTILLKGIFENKDGMLWPGEFVNVTVQLRVQADAIAVPATAIVTGQQGTFVFVVTADNKAKVRPVTVDRMVNDRAVVSSGLEGGERVVTDGQIRLTDGSAVELKAAPAPAAGAGAPQGQP